MPEADTPWFTIDDLAKYPDGTLVQVTSLGAFGQVSGVCYVNRNVLVPDSPDGFRNGGSGHGPSIGRGLTSLTEPDDVLFAAGVKLSRELWTLKRDTAKHESDIAALERAREILKNSLDSAGGMDDKTGDERPTHC